jgi:predicted dinucleotide-binding enzyme
MKITVIGRGHVGGGLAGLWEKAGHEVKALGRDGGDASDADVVVVAVPGNQIAAALQGVTGLDGQVTIDATNLYSERDTAFPSLTHQVKSIIGGPTAKSFNTVFAAAYDQIGTQRVTPSNLYAAEPAAGHHRAAHHGRGLRPALRRRHRPGRAPAGGQLGSDACAGGAARWPVLLPVRAPRRAVSPVRARGVGGAPTRRSDRLPP